MALLIYSSLPHQFIGHFGSLPKVIKFKSNQSGSFKLWTLLGRSLSHQFNANTIGQVLPATGCRTPGRPVRPAGCHSLPVHRRTNYKSSQWARLRKATSKSQNGWNYHLSMGLKLMLTTTHNGTEREPSLFFGVMGGESPAKNRKNWAPIFRHSSHSSNYCHHHHPSPAPGPGSAECVGFFLPFNSLHLLEIPSAGENNKKSYDNGIALGKKVLPKAANTSRQMHVERLGFQGFFFCSCSDPRTCAMCAFLVYDDLNWQYYAMICPRGRNCRKTTRFFILVGCVVSADYCHELGYAPPTSGNKFSMKFLVKKTIQQFLVCSRIMDYWSANKQKANKQNKSLRRCSSMIKVTNSSWVINF